MEYHYFVSYAHNRGFGNCELILERTIESIADIISLHRRIEELPMVLGVGASSPVIINFVLLRTEDLRTED